MIIFHEMPPTLNQLPNNKKVAGIESTINFYHTKFKSLTMGSLAKGVFLGCAIIFGFFQLAGIASAATTIYVNGSNSGDENGTTWASGWSTIQKGINNATAGNTVNVSAGMYNENVIVNVSVNLIGAGIDATTIHASNTSDHVISVSDTDYVNISGFNVTGAGIASVKQEFI